MEGLTGQIHGRGTRRKPELNGLFDFLANGNVAGVPFDRLRGKLNLNEEEARDRGRGIAAVRAGGGETAGGTGIVTGSVGYRFDDRSIAADLVGAGLPIASLESLRSLAFPLGGHVSFHLKVSGPMTAPQGQGNFRVVDFRIGDAVIGSFDGVLTSDGRTAKIDLSSAMTSGEISGGFALGLARPYPIAGKVAF